MSPARYHCATTLSIVSKFSLMSILGLVQRTACTQPEGPQGRDTLPPPPASHRLQPPSLSVTRALPLRGGRAVGRASAADGGRCKSTITKPNLMQDAPGRSGRQGGGVKRETHARHARNHAWRQMWCGVRQARDVVGGLRAPCTQPDTRPTGPPGAGAGRSTWCLGACGKGQAHRPPQRPCRWPAPHRGLTHSDVLRSPPPGDASCSAPWAWCAAAGGVVRPRRATP